MEDIVNTVSEVGQAVEPYAKVVQSLSSLVRAFSGTKSSDGKNAFSGIEYSELLEIVTTAQLAAIEAQSAQAKLSARIRELEEELRQQGDWEQERQRYFLKQVGPVGYVYCLKDEYICDGEPRHFLCPTCAGNAKKTLVHQVLTTGNRQLVCPDCKTVIAFKSDMLNSSA